MASNRSCQYVVAISGLNIRVWPTILAVLLAQGDYLRISKTGRSLDTQGRQDLIGLSCKGVIHSFAVEVCGPIQNGMEIGGSRRLSSE